MLVERALTRSEEVDPLAPDNLTHQIPAISDAANDLLDRQSVLGQCDNRGIRLLAPQIAFVLQLFRARKQIRINGSRTDRATKSCAWICVRR